MESVFAVIACRHVLLGAPVTRTARTLAAAAVVLLALTGCTQSNVGNVYTPGDGADGDNDSIGLRNVLIVGGETGSSALIGTVINKTDTADAITSVAVKPTNGQPIVFTKGRVPIKPRGAIYIGATAPEAGDDRRAPIRLTQSAKPGTFVTLVFSFANASDITVETPIVAPVGEFAETLIAATPKPIAAVTAE
jgi:hypothetical protein